MSDFLESNSDDPVVARIAQQVKMVLRHPRLDSVAKETQIRALQQQLMDHQRMQQMNQRTRSGSQVTQTPRFPIQRPTSYRTGAQQRATPTVVVAQPATSSTTPADRRQLAIAARQAALGLAAVLPKGNES